MTVDQAIQEFRQPPVTARVQEANHPFEDDAKSCEPGRVTLGSLKDRKNRKASIDPSERSPFAIWNPHEGQSGYCAVPWVSLSLKAKAYYPGGIFVGIPTLRFFATYDRGHGIVWRLHTASWSVMAEPPVSYLGAQWNVIPGIQSLLVPGGFFEFKSGNPCSDPEVIAP